MRLIAVNFFNRSAAPVSILFLRWRGPKSIAKMNGDHGRIAHPWIRQWV